MIPLLLAISQPAVADATADRLMLDNWHAEAKRSAAAKSDDAAWAWAAEKHLAQLVKLLLAHSWKQVLVQGERMGIPKLHLNENAKMALENAIQGKINEALKAKDSDRYEALHSVLRESMGRRHAETFISNRLGFSTTGSLINKEKTETTKAKPSVKSQATLKSHINGFQLDSESSEILKDWGGPGSDNGVIDAGEWVHLKVGIKNKSVQRWHSSSGWLSTTSDCVWAEPAKERVLSELNPNSVGHETIWLYIPESCTSPTFSLKLVVQDTHQTGGKPLATQMDLKIVKLDEVRPWATLFDKDPHGSSKPLKKGLLYPNESMEINSGIDAGGPALSAKQAFGFGEYGNKIILSSLHSEQSMPKVVAGLRSAGARGPAPQHAFIQGDDADIKTVDRAPFYQGLTSMAQAYGWQSVADYKLLIAMDIEIERPSPEKATVIDNPNGDMAAKSNTVTYRYRRYLSTPLMRWNASPVGVSEICDDGIDNDEDTAIDCADTDCKALTSCAKNKEKDLLKSFGNKQISNKAKQADLTPPLKTLSIDLGVPLSQIGLTARASKGNVFRLHAMGEGSLQIENTMIKASIGAGIRFEAIPSLSFEPYVSSGMAYWAPEEIIATIVEGGITTRWEVFNEIAVFADVLQTIPFHERLEGMPMTNLRVGISLNR